MSICDEHGGDIAYTGIDCPACMHVETVTERLEEEHNAEVGDLQIEIDELRSEIQDLEDKLGEK